MDGEAAHQVLAHTVPQAQGERHEAANGAARLGILAYGLRIVAKYGSHESHRQQGSLLFAFLRHYVSNGQAVIYSGSCQKHPAGPGMKRRPEL